MLTDEVYHFHVTYTVDLQPPVPGYFELPFALVVTCERSYQFTCYIHTKNNWLSLK